MRSAAAHRASTTAANGTLGKSPSRKLSFSSCDLDDLTQLNTLYDQCRQQVLSGEHPVSRETAIHLAAVQCFIEFGPYAQGIESSVKASNLLPKEYVRAKEHEKNILQEYKEMVTVDVTAAKKRYCKLCTSLPTYGVTFFIVKERESPTEKRLVTRLFGVSKDCVMRVDRKTKTVLKSWPLEQLRRWAASPTTFNIDFGDYVDRYYSAQTLEGEVIKKLIAEYVDIILKKRQFGDPLGIEGDEAGVMLEENAPAGRALPFLVENGRLRWRDEVHGAGLLVAEAPASDYNEDVSAISDFSRIASPPPMSAPESQPHQQHQFQNDEPFVMPIPLKQKLYTVDQQFVPIQNEQLIVTREESSIQQGRPLTQSLEETMQQIKRHNLQFQKLKQTAPLILPEEREKPLTYSTTTTNKQHTQCTQTEQSDIQRQQQVATSHFIKIANDVPEYVSDDANGAFHHVQRTTTVMETRQTQPSRNTVPITQVPIQSVPIQQQPQQYLDYRHSGAAESTSKYSDSSVYNMTTTTGTTAVSGGQFRGTLSTLGGLDDAVAAAQPTQNAPESVIDAVESNIRTEEEACLWLSPESVVELLDLPEIVANGPDAGVQLNWLIVVGTHAVSQHLGTFVVVIAQILESTSPYTLPPTPSEAIRARQIASAGVVLADLVACVRELAALLWRVSEQVARKLLNKTQRLCEALRLFMEQLHPASRAKRAAVLSAASLVGETTCALLSTTSRDDTENVDDNTQAFYDVLNERIQNIASSTANVVLQAKTFLAAAPQRGRLFQCATQVAFTASEFIALARVLSSVLASHASSQQRVAESVQRVATTINEIVVEASAQFAQMASDSAAALFAADQRKRYDQLLSTANFANNALHHFLTEIHQSNAKKTT